MTIDFDKFDEDGWLENKLLKLEAKDPESFKEVKEIIGLAFECICERLEEIQKKLQN